VNGNSRTLFTSSLTEKNRIFSQLSNMFSIWPSAFTPHLYAGYMLYLFLFFYYEAGLPFTERCGRLKLGIKKNLRPCPNIDQKSYIQSISLYQAEFVAASQTEPSCRWTPIRTWSSSCVHRSIVVSIILYVWCMHDWDQCRESV
jgi:hypothetical protein